MLAAVTDVGWDKSPGDVFRPRSGEFARKALGMVGCGEEVVAPWWSHDLMWRAMEVCPAWLMDWVFIPGSKKMLKVRFPKKV